MTDITPPPELVKSWVSDCLKSTFEEVFINIARWGADQQLELDAEWLDQNGLDRPHLQITPTGKALTEAMRSRPLGLSQGAMEALDELYDIAGVPLATVRRIRRAIERLRELEASA